MIFDYRMPNKDGLAAAIEILELCPSQRIMFASAYTDETLVAAVKNLRLNSGRINYFELLEEG